MVVLKQARRWGGTILVLVFLAGAFLAPFVWVVASALKPEEAIFRDMSPIGLRTLIPLEPTLGNLTTVFVERDLGRALLNSLLVSGGQVAGTLVVCSMAAYALTRMRIRGQKLFLGAILLMFLVPYEALLVPMYRLMGGLGLSDTLVAVFLPWLASPLGLFLLRPAFEELPRELDEAAKMDGANHFQVFALIVLPNVRTALVTLALVTFLFSWNAYLWPLIVLQSPENTLIQVAVARSLAPGQLPNWGETFAGSAIAMTPLFILFLLLQPFFVKGMAGTGMK